MKEETVTYEMEEDILYKRALFALKNITNSKIAPGDKIHKNSGDNILTQYILPEINLDHLRKMTTSSGIIRFSEIDQPDLGLGYTLDNNAQALITMCMHYKMTGDENDVNAINLYLRFVKRSLQPAGNFLKYVDKDNKFSPKNNTADLDDANGMAVWALGYVVSLIGLLPYEIISSVITVIKKPLLRIGNLHSTRAMAFALKGLYYYHTNIKSQENLFLIKSLADRLVNEYRHEPDSIEEWFGSPLTNVGSILPEAMLYAWLLTGETKYRKIAQSSFDFLLSQIFNEKGLEDISNRSLLTKGPKTDNMSIVGEQPFDVACTIMTLSNFYDVFGYHEYYKRMVMAFEWFLGNNRLHQTIYNSDTGGCHNGLENTHVSLNQGAESTLSYLMARLTLEKYVNV